VRQEVDPQDLGRKERNRRPSKAPTSMTRISAVPPARP
jgi:hypothetical protein